MQLRVGIAVRGLPGQAVDRPHGSDDYVFIQFLAAARLLTPPGRADGGDCIVLRPLTPTYIDASPTVYNHYVHISNDVAEPALARFDIETDRVVHPVSTDFVEPTLTRLQAEWARRDVHAARAIELVVEDLVLNLHRETVGHRAPNATPHDAVLREIRLETLRNPASDWSVPEMAAAAGLQPTRFTALYRGLFGRSPMADVIETRLDHARYLLTQTNISVTDAGRFSGFADPSAFSRRFRTRYGLSPRAYRTCIASNDREAL